MFSRLSLALIVVLSSSTLALAQGRLAGCVATEAGKGLGAIAVVLDETEAIRITDRDGCFVFERLPEGVYSITIRLGERAHTITSIAVQNGTTATVETTVDWELSFTETLTVTSASRRVERAVDAPAAVIALSEAAITRESGHGEVPRLLENASGVDVVNPSGFFYELNTRGFNGINNRRVQVFFDGVDQSVPFAGFQEWFPRNLMDLASVELVKGPSSSLYGANAFNGVLNLVTKRPKESQGGSLRLTGGDPAFFRTDLRWAGDLSTTWFVKLVGNYQEGKYFSRSRSETTEYEGLPIEALPLPEGKVRAENYSLRFDRHFEGDSLLTLESGFQELGGKPVAIAFVDRFTLIEPIEQSWLRLEFAGPHFSLLGFYTVRDAPDFIALSTGEHFFDDAERRHLEVLVHDEFGRLRMVGGASYREEDIGHAVIAEPLSAQSKAVFGQIDYELSDRARIVAAARWDESTLHEGRVSPKVGLVFGINPRRTLRLTYNEAFQSPTYADFFLDLPFFLPTPAGPVSSIDLSPLEASLCTPFGVSCGFQMTTPVRLVGNENLEEEEITAIELGYTGIFGDRSFLPVDYYRNALKSFLTQPLFNPFGTFNSRFSPYQPPPGHPDPALLSATLQELLGPFFPFLLNDVDGSPVFIPLGITNTGRVDLQGLDVALSSSIRDQLQLDFTYSWFDFEVQDEGLGGALFPNTPEHKFALGFTYTAPKFDISARVRWVEDFSWGSGVFVGPVLSYNVVSLTSNYVFNDRFAVGVNVANLLDDRHYEAFGGDLLERRSVLSLTFNW